MSQNFHIEGDNVLYALDVMDSGDDDTVTIRISSKENEQDNREITVSIADLKLVLRKLTTK